MLYKYFLFDFDGTVADTVPLIMETFRHVFKVSGGEPVSDDYLLSTIGEPLEKTFDVLPRELRQGALEEYFAYNRSHLDHGVGIFYRLIRAIEEIKDIGGVTGLVTSKRHESAFHTIEQFGIGYLFDQITVREDTSRHKPHPDPVLEAIRRISEKTGNRNDIILNEVLFVGDSIHDLVSAKRAGTHTAIVDWTHMDRSVLIEAAPEHWIKDPSELVEMCYRTKEK
ncbi:MAG: HAD hydrolase-like protein [Eubacteriales bacterium]|nr:HAD hydrolase-like protein [Eubacteriales bacterium]MDD4326714.1 HAD hydrolase-like protein [Eubacteriales bacterium]MDD4716743.1 HAD hydrolase-like protein [Eubacteriales bacterium]